MSGISNIGSLKGIVQEIANPEKQSSAQSSGQPSPGFQDALKEAVSARQNIETQSTTAINSTTGIQAPTENAFNTTMAQKTEHLLDLMDYYAKGLANRDKTLKDLEPIAVSMKENASELFQQTRDNGAIDESLNKIARATALTANVEYAKFSRGDYI
ncbi:MAG: hypothetical protein SWH68_06060 [Thermodesulfobacteriota bacterium]|nr:hypothetical protein [Thermodesulfobacteriota bacterium]